MRLILVLVSHCGEPGDYAYVAARDEGLQVFAIANGFNLQPIGRFKNSNVRSIEGVAISGNHAYVVAGYSGLVVIDISNPSNPQRVGGYLHSRESLGYASARAVTLSRNHAYLAHSSGVEVGFSSSVLDVTDTKAGNSAHRFYRTIEVKP